MEVTVEPAPDSAGMVPPLSDLSQLTSLSAIPSASGNTRSRDLAAALKEAGIDRRRAYVTNAVKHFKWMSGRIRLKPRSSSV